MCRSTHSIEVTSYVRIRSFIEVAACVRICSLIEVAAYVRIRSFIEVAAYVYIRSLEVGYKPDIGYIDMKNLVCYAGFKKSYQNKE